MKSFFVFLSALAMPIFPLPLDAQSGAIDPLFDPGTGVDLAVYSIAIQPNSQILIGGNFTSFDDVERVNIARLAASGSRDDTFAPGTAVDGSFPYVNAVALQPTGKVLLGGGFTNTASTNLTRLNANGNLDSGFKMVVDDSVNAIAVLADGSILIGGFFTHVNGQARTGIARLDSTGAVDLGFNPTLFGGFAAVYSLAVQGDGKILVGGSFTNVSNSLRTNIARLNTNGTLDATFKPVAVGGGQLSPAVFYSLALDAQGHVVVGGDFTSVNGSVRTNLARFTSDGSLDSGFNAAAGTDFPVNSVALEPYGKILVAGYFNVVNGVGNNYIARLHSDGRLDSSFNAGSGASDVVYSVALQPDGKILVGGAFIDFNGSFLSGIARLQNLVTVSPPQLVNPVFSNHVFTVSVPTFTGKSYVLQFKNSLSDSSGTSLSPVAGDGTLKALTDPSATVPGRLYRVAVQ